MTIKASDANKLLCDNNTGKTHHVIGLIYERKLGFLDNISSKKQFFLFAKKFIRISRRIKQDKHRQFLYQLQTQTR